MTPADLGEEIRVELQRISERLARLEENTGIHRRVWLTPAEMSKIAGVSPRTLQTYVTNGKITRPSFKREARGKVFTYRYHRELTMRDLGLS